MLLRDECTVGSEEHRRADALVRERKVRRVVVGELKVVVRIADAEGLHLRVVGRDLFHHSLVARGELVDLLLLEGEPLRVDVATKVHEEQLVHHPRDRPVLAKEVVVVPYPVGAFLQDELVEDERPGAKHVVRVEDAELVLIQQFFANIGIEDGVELVRHVAEPRDLGLIDLDREVRGVHVVDTVDF